MSTVSFYVAPGLKETPFGFYIQKRMDFIEKLVCQYTNESYETVRMKLRRRSVVLSRAIIYYFLKKFTSLTLKQMTNYYGGHDHTTAIYGMRLLRDLMHTEPSVKKEVLEMESKIEAELN